MQEDDLPDRQGSMDSLPPAFAVVMAGGQGTRLWPLSRQAFPKQFLPLAPGGQTLLQAAVHRASRLVGSLDSVLVLAGKSHASLVRRQLPDFPGENLILEPVGRNTAACLGLAALQVQKRLPGALMAALPSDHLYSDEQPWLAALRTALVCAAGTENLVAVGIPPASPSSGYGYLHLGRMLSVRGACPSYEVQAFIEKPDAARARSFLQSGEYLWNTGTYAWQVSVFVAALARYMPRLAAGLERIAADPQHLDELYPGFDDLSVDYGIMEKARNVAVVRGDFQRIDVGNLASLSQVWQADPQANAHQGLIAARDSRDNIVSTDDGLVGLIGVEGMIVVRQGDVVLVCPKERAGEVKDLLAALDREGLGRFR